MQMISIKLMWGKTDGERKKPNFLWQPVKSSAKLVYQHVSLPDLHHVFVIAEALIES